VGGEVNYDNYDWRSGFTKKWKNQMSKKPVIPIDLHDPWQEIRVESWKFFDKSIEELGYRQCLFRGQSCSDWSLRTSLDMSFDSNQKIIFSAKGKKRSFAKTDHEEFLIKSFQKKREYVFEILAA
jgi:hypothetical protein